MDKSPEIERVFDALNDLPEPPDVLAEPDPQTRLTLRIIEALVHLDGRLQQLEARS